MFTPLWGGSAQTVRHFKENQHFMQHFFHASQLATSISFRFLALLITAVVPYLKGVQNVQTFTVLVFWWQLFFFFFLNLFSI